MHHREEFIQEVGTMLRDFLSYERITPNTIEPPEGSVVIRDGLTGTAYQRHHSDGLWHSTGGGEPVSFNYFLNRYDPKMAGDYIIFVPEPEVDG